MSVAVIKESTKSQIEIDTLDKKLVVDTTVEVIAIKNKHIGAQSTTKMPLQSFTPMNGNAASTSTCTEPLADTSKSLNNATEKLESNFGAAVYPDKPKNVRSNSTSKIPLRARKKSDGNMSSVSSRMPPVAHTTKTVNNASQKSKQLHANLPTSSSSKQDKSKNVACLTAQKVPPHPNLQRSLTILSIKRESNRTTTNPSTARKAPLSNPQRSVTTLSCKKESNRTTTNTSTAGKTPPSNPQRTLTILSIKRESNRTTTNPSTARKAPPSNPQRSPTILTCKRESNRSTTDTSIARKAPPPVKTHRSATTLSCNSESNRTTTITSTHSANKLMREKTKLILKVKYTVKDKPITENLSVNPDAKELQNRPQNVRCKTMSKIPLRSRTQIADNIVSTPPSTNAIAHTTNPISIATESHKDVNASFSPYQYVKDSTKLHLFEDTKASGETKKFNEILAAYSGAAVILDKPLYGRGKTISRIPLRCPRQTSFEKSQLISTTKDTNNACHNNKKVDFDLSTVSPSQQESATDTKCMTEQKPTPLDKILKCDMKTSEETNEFNEIVATDSSAAVILNKHLNVRSKTISRIPLRYRKQTDENALFTSSFKKTPLGNSIKTLNNAGESNKKVDADLSIVSPRRLETATDTKCITEHVPASLDKTERNDIKSSGETKKFNEILTAHSGAAVILQKSGRSKTISRIPLRCPKQMDENALCTSSLTEVPLAHTIKVSNNTCNNNEKEDSNLLTVSSNGINNFEDNNKSNEYLAENVGDAGILHKPLNVRSKTMSKIPMRCPKGTDGNTLSISSLSRPAPETQKRSKGLPKREPTRLDITQKSGLPKREPTRLDITQKSATSPLLRSGVKREKSNLPLLKTKNNVENNTLRTNLAVNSGAAVIADKPKNVRSQTIIKIPLRDRKPIVEKTTSTITCKECLARAAKLQNKVIGKNTLSVTTSLKQETSNNNIEKGSLPSEEALNEIVRLKKVISALENERNDLQVQLSEAKENGSKYVDAQQKMKSIQKQITSLRDDVIKRERLEMEHKNLLNEAHNEIISYRRGKITMQREMNTLKFRLSRATVHIDQLEEQVRCDITLLEAFREKIYTLPSNNQPQRVEIVEERSNTLGIKQTEEEHQKHIIKMLEESNERSQILRIKQEEKICSMEDEIIQLKQTIGKFKKNMAVSARRKIQHTTPTSTNDEPNENFCFNVRDRRRKRHVDINVKKYDI